MTATDWIVSIVMVLVLGLTRPSLMSRMGWLVFAAVCAVAMAVAALLVMMAT